MLKNCISLITLKTKQLTVFLNNLLLVKDQAEITKQNSVENPKKEKKQPTFSEYVLNTINEDTTVKEYRNAH